MSIKGQPLKRGAACEGEPRQPLRRCAACEGEPKGNPSGAARQLLPSHRNAPLGRSGVAHGLFSEKSIRCSFLQNAHASGSLREPYGYRGAEGQPLSPLRRTAPPLRTETPLRDVPVLRMAFFPKRAYHALFSKTHMLQVRCANPTGTGEPRQPLRRCAPAPPFAPTQLFELRRCCAWLILRFRTDPPSVRRCSARLIRQAETLELQPLRGLHQATLCSFLQNAHASGSLREPYGYRGAKAAHRAALLREKRPRRRLLRGRWKRGIGIFTASGGCRPVRCGRR